MLLADDRGRCRPVRTLTGRNRPYKRRALTNYFFPKDAALGNVSDLREEPAEDPLPRIFGAVPEDGDCLFTRRRLAAAVDQQLAYA